jgi:phthiocerol/phenolphthiocerol synthesis type-I polyketide synthase D
VSCSAAPPATSAHTSLVVLGLDSLGTVQLQQRLQNALKTQILPGVIWVNATAARLAEWLFLQHMGLQESEEEH